ncbi:MAG TPA: hypothetical protein VF624_18390 [Tepidisphaeraceae bacterium]|jgi:hypothetical protein
MSQIVDTFGPIFLLPEVLNWVLAAGVGTALWALLRTALAARPMAAAVRVRSVDRPRFAFPEDLAFAPAKVVTRYPTRGPPLQSPLRPFLPDRDPGALGR